MPKYVKVQGTWKAVDESADCGKVKVNGVWRTVSNSYVKVANVWKAVCAPAPVSTTTTTTTPVTTTTTTTTVPVTTTTTVPVTTTTTAQAYPNISSAIAYGAGAGQAWTSNAAYITWGGSGWGSYTVIASNGSSSNSASSAGGPPVLLTGFSASTPYSVTVTLFANANYSGQSASASTSFTTAAATTTTTTTPVCPFPGMTASYDSPCGNTCCDSDGRPWVAPSTTTTTTVDPCTTCNTYSPYADGTYGTRSVATSTCPSGSQYYRVCVTPSGCLDITQTNGCVPVTTTTTAASCTMPSVVGLTEGAASTAITNAGIAYEFTSYSTVGATAQNNGYVKAQDPAPGTVGTCGYTVNATLTLYSYTAPTTATTTTTTDCVTCLSTNPTNGAYTLTKADATCPDTGSRYYRVCITAAACPNYDQNGSCVPAPVTTTTAATTTTTTTTASYPTLLAGLHYCAAGDAPNPASPCPSNGSGTGVNCVDGGASGASCAPATTSTVATTTAATTTAATTTACNSKFRCKSYDVTNSASTNYYDCYSVDACTAPRNPDGSRASCCA